MMNSLTRRQFLKLAGSAVCAAACLPFMDVERVLAGEAEPQVLPPPPASLGRVASWGVEIHTKPKPGSRLVRIAQRDEVLPLYEQTIGEAADRKSVV
jgi:hypothetical protein